MIILIYLHYIIYIILSTLYYLHYIIYIIICISGEATALFYKASFKCKICKKNHVNLMKLHNASSVWYRQILYYFETISIKQNHLHRQNRFFQSLKHSAAGLTVCFHN